MLGATQAIGEGPETDGVLVLRNGSVLSGSVLRIGDDYRIETRGGVLQIPSGQVERFALSLTAAYEARRRDSAGDSADAHVDLARWCLQVDLLEQAARELLDARTLEPGHRGAGLVELQLRQMIDASARREMAEVSATVAARLPASIGAADVDGSATANSEPSIELSAEVRVQFVRCIQPMLVQSCATGGCHQPGSQQALQLDRWALVGKGNAEIVRRNLAAVLRELDVDDPLASPLLHMARAPHGYGASGRSRPITARQGALLVDWLNSAAGIQPPPTVAAETAQNLDAVDDTVELAAYEESLDESSTPASKLAADGAVRFQPRDPFDPEIFNRRFAELAVDLAPDAEGAATALPSERPESEPPPAQSPSPEP
jgi:hypothetical protein